MRSIRKISAVVAAVVSISAMASLSGCGNTSSGSVSGNSGAETTKAAADTEKKDSGETAKNDETAAAADNSAAEKTDTGDAFDAGGVTLEVLTNRTDRVDDGSLDALQRLLSRRTTAVSSMSAIRIMPEQSLQEWERRITAMSS